MLHPSLRIHAIRSIGTFPPSRSTTGEKAPWRLGQGWIVESSESQAPGAGRSYPHSGTKWGCRGRDVLIGNRAASGGEGKNALCEQDGKKRRGSGTDKGRCSNPARATANFQTLKFCPHFQSKKPLITREIARRRSPGTGQLRANQ